MSKSLGVRRSNVKVACAIEVMQLMVRNGAQLDDVFIDLQVAQQCPRPLGFVGPRIFSGCQLTCEQQSHFTGRMATVDLSHTSQECFEISIVVVVAYKQQSS